MNPFSIPKITNNTLSIGARRFVVHEAAEIILCSEVLYFCMLTPCSSVTSGYFADAEIKTFFAPAFR